MSEPGRANVIITQTGADGSGRVWVVWSANRGAAAREDEDEGPRQLRDEPPPERHARRLVGVTTNATHVLVSDATAHAKAAAS